MFTNVFINLFKQCLYTCLWICLWRSSLYKHIMFGNVLNADDCYCMKLIVRWASSFYLYLYIAPNFLRDWLSTVINNSQKNIVRSLIAEVEHCLRKSDTTTNALATLPTMESVNFGYSTKNIPIHSRNMMGYVCKCVYKLVYGHVCKYNVYFYEGVAIIIIIMFGNV